MADSFGRHDSLTDRHDANERPVLRICALLPEAETATSILECAVAGSRGFAAHIDAVHVGFDPKHSLVSAEENDLQQLRDIYEGPPEIRAARVKAAVEAFLSSATDAPPIAWRDDEGDIGVNVVLESRRADLIVIGRPIHLDAADALHSALFDAHRLVLIAPRDVAAGERTIGRHIVIGWKPGTPAERTAAAALPWLRKAGKVSVLWVAKAGAAPYGPGARAFFENLGVSVDITRLERDTRSVGAQLLDEAIQLGADCLLIGAYRHGELWESLFGGVTHDVLKRVDLPTFMMRG